MPVEKLGHSAACGLTLFVEPAHDVLAPVAQPSPDDEAAGRPRCSQQHAAARSEVAYRVRQAVAHIKIIKAHFENVPLSAVKPSDVRSWTAVLKDEGRADSYVDARQAWALYDAVPAGVQPAVLQGAHAGLRLAEAAALRVEDVDLSTAWWRRMPSGWMNRSRPTSAGPRSRSPRRCASPRRGDPARRRAVPGQRPVGQPGGTVDDRTRHPSLPRSRGTDQRLPVPRSLRHYFASLLIASGLDVKVVQARLRHASAKTTLDSSGHLWPDRDDSSRAAPRHGW